ncbi:MAG: polysaccharide biosynthesis protein [Lachnospiraceae bacterium]|nr:polysaccharide biosynthesis protein [Lachnospiraceae bacterium]
MVITMETTNKKLNAASGFLKQGSILAVASILVRMIGLLYRIPMANIIGSEGNGIYSSAFEIYNILLIISSYGMPMAVSKMVSAKCVEKKYKEAYHIFRCSMIFSLCTGGAAALFVFFGADWLEKNFFKSFYGIAIPLRILAPTIFVVAIMGTLRGLFQGRKTMMPTAISQIFEQIVNAVVSVAAAFFLMRAHSASEKFSAWGAAGGTLGTSMGAMMALIFLVFVYLLYRPVMKKQQRRDRVSEEMTVTETYKLILWTAIPIILSQTVYQLSGIIDVSLINWVLLGKGISGTQISTWQGIYSTQYRTLVSVPIAVSTAIASSMVPSLVASYIGKDKHAVHRKVNLAVKFNMIIAFPSAVGMAVLAVPIIHSIYPAMEYKTGSMMMIIGSSCIIFYALSTVTSGILQSIDQMRLPVFHSLISLIVHIILVWLLMRFTGLGVYALVIGNVTYPLLVCVLNGYSVSAHLGFKQEVTKCFCVPFLSSVIMGVLTFAVFKLFHAVSGSNVISLLPALAVAVVSYFILVLKLKGLTRDELYEFPFGRKMSIVADKLRLLEEDL